MAWWKEKPSMSNLVMPFLEALDSLASNKLRSALTILGIVIGVGAVIAVMSLGAGAESSITGQIEGIGTNLIFVVSGGAEGVRKVEPLTLGDADAINDPLTAPAVLSVAPALQGSVEVTFGGQTTNTTIYGTTPSYGPVRNTDVTEGEFLNEAHQLGRAAVAVIGTDTAENLFGRKAGLVGETVRIEGQPFRIIGVLEEKGGSGFSNEDAVIIIPLSTAQTRLLRRGNADQVDMILLQSTSAETVDQAVEEVSQVLRQRHRVQIGEDDFSILTQRDFLSTFASITGVLTIFLGGIAAISLVVGGIGIMNIMLVSVIERTREIGLRKAVGAKKRDILVQFLTESILLSLGGGIVGIGLGWTISVVVGQVAAANDVEFIPVVGLSAILLATVSSTLVGLLSGLYPAYRAANLQPVEALRSD
jgi:putative ABC transport system permease protein